jgi:Protein of unknown function (DUF1566)
MTFNEASKCAGNLGTGGHDDWRLATRAELAQLFNHRAAIGGFSGAQYWCGSPSYDDRIYLLSFNDGSEDHSGDKADRHAFRCVRSVWKF